MTAMTRTRIAGALLFAGALLAAPARAQTSGGEPGNGRPRRSSDLVVPVDSASEGSAARSRAALPAAAADDEVEAPVPDAGALDPAALRAAFLDLVGRPPYAAERETWAGRPLVELVDALLGSEESWAHWLEEQLYYFFLIDNFRPESERVSALPPLLAEGKLDVRDAIHRIALSPSFDQRNPGADTFVTVVMEQLNGVEVQKRPRELEIAKAIYDGAPGTFLGTTGRSQSDLLRIAVADRSFAETLVAREHRRLLRAEADRKAFADWTRRLHRDPREYVAIVREWMLSPAWRRRVAAEVEAPNRLFVRALYVDLLGRLPDDLEARRLRSALDGLSDATPLRAVVARMLLDSGQVAVPARRDIDDPTKWVGEQFERLLGRRASPAELKSFVEAFHDPACRPTTVLYALVTAPEYQAH
jgi:hypothetical protein